MTDYIKPFKYLKSDSQDIYFIKDLACDFLIVSQYHVQRQTNNEFILLKSNVCVCIQSLISYSSVLYSSVVVQKYVTQCNGVAH